jgi:hypothetical protein
MRILIATPAYGGLIYVGHFTSILKLERLFHEKGIQVDYEYCYNESLIPRARNTLARTFMNTDYTHLLFLDADIEFDPYDILKLIDADKDLIAGLYPKKNVNWEQISNVIKNNKDIEITPELLKVASREAVVITLNDTDINSNNDIIETRYTGTGIMLIKRTVFEQMKEKFFNDNYDSGGIIYFRFFDTELKYGVYLSEDYWFCDRWREIGGKVFLLKNFNCKHWGTYAY